MRRTLRLLLLLGIGLALAGKKPDSPSGTPGEFDDVDIPPKFKGLQGNSTPENHADIDDKLKEGDLESGNSDDSPSESDSVQPGDADNNGTTTPSGTPDSGNTPRGDPEEVKGNGEKKRGIRRQNESAETLAEHGYDVEQSPPGKDNGKNPDYKIEGEYFDCYAPKTGNLDNIRGVVSDKVGENQAERIILNLDDSPADQAALRSLLERRPIEGLEEIKIVKDGQVIDFYPF